MYRDDKLTPSRPKHDSGTSVRLLPDEPTAADQFGTHAELAKVIAEVIKTEQGGKAIAIEGGWGSGKSSVVEMLKEHLEGDGSSNVHVHVFDAWSHEGDPLRRVFLETLTRVCAPEFAKARQSAWEDREAREITGRHRTTDQTTTPVLKSKWSILTLSIAAAYPVAIVGLAGLFRQEFIGGWLLFWSLLALLGIALVPTIGLFILFVRCRDGAPEKLRAAGKYIALWNKKIDEDTTTSVHETAGPTSIEFQRYFSDLLKEYLADFDRQLVIVLDNLDRIPTDTAQTLWATLRLFADSCEKARHSWGHKVWFVVPYDPDAARRIWDDEGTTSDQEGEKKGTDSSNRAEEKNDSDTHPQPAPPRLSAAFLDKTFQIRFDVPPLLVADWKEHLIKLLHLAFGEVEDDVAHRVYLLSRSLTEKKRRPPTPRHLTLYVNDIGALKRRFRHFDLDHLALYAILRREGRDVRLWLLEEHDEKDRFAKIFPDDSFRDTLCAVAHGTNDIDAARVLLLHEPIIAALKTGDGEELMGLVTLRGFWQELDAICRSRANAFGTAQAEVVNVFQAVDKAHLLEAKVAEVSALVDHLRWLIQHVQWSALSHDVGVAAVRACKMLRDPSLTKEVVARIASLSASEGDDHSGPFDIRGVASGDWIDGMTQIAEGLSNSKHWGMLEETVVLPAVENAIELLSELWHASQRDHILQTIRFAGHLPVLVKSLCPDREIDEWPEQSEAASLTLCHTPSVDTDWSSLQSSIFDRLSIDGDLEQSEVARLVRVAHILTQEKGVTSDSLHAFGQSAAPFARIKNCEANVDSETVARVLACVITYGNLTKAPSKPDQVVQGFQLAQTILATPSDYPNVVDVLAKDCTEGDEDGFLVALIDSPAVALAAAVLRELWESDRLGIVVTASLFIRNFSEFKAIADAEVEGKVDWLCQELLKHDTFRAGLDSVAIEDGALPGHVCLVTNGGTLQNAGYRCQVEQFLSNRGAEEWRTSLKELDDAYNLLAAVRIVHPDFQLGGRFAEAFQDDLAALLDEDEAIEVPEAWNTVRDALPESSQGTIAASLIQLADHPDRNLGAILPLLETRLRVAAVNYDSASFVRNVMLRLLSSDYEAALEWVATVAEDGPRFWSETSSDDRNTFHQRLKEILQDAEGEARARLVRIAQAFSLPLDSSTLSEPSEGGGGAEGSGKED